MTKQDTVTTSSLHSRPSASRLPLQTQRKARLKWPLLYCRPRDCRSTELFQNLSITWRLRRFSISNVLGEQAPKTEIEELCLINFVQIWPSEHWLQAGNTLFKLLSPWLGTYCHLVRESTRPVKNVMGISSTQESYFLSISPLKSWKYWINRGLSTSYSVSLGFTLP